MTAIVKWLLQRLPVAAAMVMLAGCANWITGSGSSDWPENLPPRAEFVDRYEADAANQAVQSLDNYLMWVKRFYNGWHLYANGWNDLVPEVLSGVDDPEQRTQLSDQLQSMGKTLASEWSKEVESHRVRTRHLSVWGNAMREALVKGEVVEMVEQISRDLDRLMSDQIAVSDIRAGRYYQPDENDVFAP